MLNRDLKRKLGRRVIDTFEFRVKIFKSTQNDKEGKSSLSFTSDSRKPKTKIFDIQDIFDCIDPSCC